MRMVTWSLCLAAVWCGGAVAEAFNAPFPTGVERIWIGPEYWANRLQDWRIANGRLECRHTGPRRAVTLLTHDVAPGNGSLELAVTVGIDAEGDDAWAGFVVGRRGPVPGYQSAAVHGSGMPAALTGEGNLRLGDALAPIEGAPETVRLQLRLADGTLMLAAHDATTGARLGVIEQTANNAVANGCIALESHQPGDTARDAACAWFDDWTAAGSRLRHHPGRAFGPILFTQYTLSRGTLTLTAQLPPTGPQDGQSAVLDVATGPGGAWVKAAKSAIDPRAYTATFRVEGWDALAPVPYRVRYALALGDGAHAEHAFAGIIRRDPVDDGTVTVAAFTGNNDTGFPHGDVTAQVAALDPDLLFFSGDQLYERVGGFGVVREPLDLACLDYLNKWFIFGWAYRDLMRDRPTVSIPDDHDVFHGNIWGAGGKAASREGTHFEMQDSGGYRMPPEFVNMVQRTQTSHLPPPFDPTPVEQGIGVYYTAIDYGGLSFAVLEDRKFKSAPRALIPEGDIINGWPQDPDYDAAAEGDVPGADLLGQRQLDFLAHWAADWGPDTEMKVVLSQTIFANVATLPEDALSDAIVPKLAIFKPGEYPPNDVPVADHDSNGWPQTPRNAALKIMRKAFAFHIAGDQHLGSVVHYGVDEFGDAAWAFCVPAVSNVWPRRWFPRDGGANRGPGAPKYTGDFHDGFGNKITVQAVSNPYATGREPAEIYDRATGFGLIQFDKAQRTAQFNAYPRFAEPGRPDAAQYPGWPVTVPMAENFGATPTGHLAELRFATLENPVVQVIDESTGALVYNVRVQGTAFRPWVVGAGPFTVRAFDPTNGGAYAVTGLEPGGADAIVMDLPEHREPRDE